MAHEAEEPQPSTPEITDLEPTADPKGGGVSIEAKSGEKQAYLKVTINDVMVSSW